MSASEIEKAESRNRSRLPRQYTEEYRLEAVEYYRRAREADPKKSIRECASEPGTSDKTLNEWILKQAKTGRVTQERTGEQKELDAVEVKIDFTRRDCGGNLGPNSSYAARPKSLRYCMGLL